MSLLTPQRTSRFPGTVVLLTALVLVLPEGQGAFAHPLGEGPIEKPPPSGGPAGPFEMRFADGSLLKLVLRDPHLILKSPYGKLHIPIGDIQRVEFATRVAPETMKRVGMAIEKLGSTTYQERELAETELLELGDKAYVSLQKASQDKDPEVSRRAESLVEKIRATVASECLEVRPFDVIHTEHSKIAGRIEMSALRASTVQFGDVEVKLADVHSLRSLSLGTEAEEVAALPDPGNLARMQAQIGKTLTFRVVGAATGSLWGTDIYTLDSTLGLAAVHAGAVKAGQTGVVKVKIVGPQGGFRGSARHGVISSDYGFYPGGYEIVKGK